ncbi:MAG: hypothetical protein LZF86_190649 [Nitrospira sp.]|nr:MAG: hypothetical protein LZF86_190649 [Nitrospira sp.]
MRIEKFDRWDWLWRETLWVEKIQMVLFPSITSLRHDLGPHNDVGQQPPFILVGWRGIREAWETLMATKEHDEGAIRDGRCLVCGQAER